MDFEDVDQAKYEDRLKEAADRADKIYGARHGGAAFKDALQLAKIVKGPPGTAEFRTNLIDQMIKGGEPARADFERYRRLWEIERAEQAFAEPEAPAPVRSFRRPMPDVRPENAADAPPEQPLEWMGGFRGAAPREAPVRQPAVERKKPNAKQEDWIRNNPDQWETFDGKFYPGAAAEAIAKGKKQ